MWQALMLALRAHRGIKFNYVWSKTSASWPLALGETLRRALEVQRARWTPSNTSLSILRLEPKGAHNAAQSTPGKMRVVDNVETWLKRTAIFVLQGRFFKRWFLNRCSDCPSASILST